MKDYWVYIMASHSGVLYTGITNDLGRRVAEHKSGVVPGFTKKYRVTKLVYFERYTDVKEAISREKQIKAWRRSKKVSLIETLNRDWKDLGNTEESYEEVRTADGLTTVS